MTKVDVTAKDIRQGVPGDCFGCAVALALQRATGDVNARVVDHDCQLHVEVNGRWIVPPHKATDFAVDFDHLPRTRSGRARLPSPLPEELRPFSFELPPLDDPVWEEECYGCEQLFAPKTLDYEGRCEECRTETT